MMLREPTPDAGDQTKTAVTSRRARADVWVPKPVKIAPAIDEKPEDFTEDVFEDALDRVSRSVKGKYADVPYSSEDLIRDKRTEVELEDR